MSDYVLRGMAANGQILCFAADTSELTEDARLRHQMKPLASVALGRTMAAAAMMACQLKKSEEMLTIQIEGNGPIEKIEVIADGAGRVRGYVNKPELEMPLNSKGKLDVAGALGIGVMSITKDLGLKDPYTGSTHLITSEIAEDLAYYFTVSEQLPSAVALGALVNKDESIWAAGGYILQMMPGALDETAEKLQERVLAFPSVTEYLAQGHTPEELLQDLLGDMGLVLTDKKEVNFSCSCNHEKVSAALLSIGAKDLQELIDEGEPVEMGCHFCNEKYVFSLEDLKELHQAALQK